MPRRVHIPRLTVGDIDLADSQARHVRDSLRLAPGEIVEAFDDAGATAQATILTASARGVTLHIDRIEPPPAMAFTWTVGAAVPKGPRADWMVEKLSELGAAAFIPLQTARSVAMAPGTGKLDRWLRLAAEAAKQCGRAGVMRIEPLRPVAEVIEAIEPNQTAWYFSTKPDAAPIGKLIREPRPKSLLLLIGPEGGWTDQEYAMFDKANIKAVKLTQTILRIETAALAAATLAAVWEEDSAEY